MGARIVETTLLDVTGVAFPCAASSVGYAYDNKETNECSVP
jgi:hypothetical protein